VFWGAVDKLGDAIGETVAGVVGTDLDNSKSPYYITDEDLSELFSETLLKNKCQVTRVADGDTIDVDCPFKKEESVRYAFLNTPEVRKKVNGKWEEDNQCFGKEASNINKELVEGKKVILIDLLPDYKDPYGRRISTVIVNDGKDKNLMVNEFLVGEGYAKVYKQKEIPILKFGEQSVEEALENIEEKARDNNKGLWGKCN